MQGKKPNTSHCGPIRTFGLCILVLMIGFKHVLGWQTMAAPSQASTPQVHVPHPRYIRRVSGSCIRRDLQMPPLPQLVARTGPSTRMHNTQYSNNSGVSAMWHAWAAPPHCCQLVDIMCAGKKARTVAHSILCIKPAFTAGLMM